MKKLFFLILLFPFVVNAQTRTDSTIVVNDLGDTIRYVTVYRITTYTPGDSIVARNDASKRRTIVSPLDLPISTAAQTALDGKQATLVSATNIKTINGSSVLGSGDLVVSGGSSGTTLLTLASNYSNSTTTQTPVTGWTIPVTSGKIYRIIINAGYQTAATTTGGSLGVYMLTGAGTVTGEMKGHITQSAAASPLSVTVRTCTTLGAAGSSLTTTAVNPANQHHYIGADIVFTCTGTGNLQIGWATEVAASAAQLNGGSTLIYQVLN